MLTWLRKKQIIFAPGIIAIFLSGLLTLFCQNCLANMDHEVDVSVVSNDDDHCSHMGIDADKDSDKTGPTQSDKPCMGICDCEDNNVLFADKQSITINENIGFSDIKVFLNHESSWPGLSLVNKSNFIGKPYIPDRACYSPLERICVLLN